MATRTTIHGYTESLTRVFFSHKGNRFEACRYWRSDTGSMGVEIYQHGNDGTGIPDWVRYARTGAGQTSLDRRAMVEILMAESDPIDRPLELA